MVRVYLDETLLSDEPIGVRDITEVIENDDNIHGIMVKYNQISLTFFGDGAKYINEQIRKYGYDHRIAIKIEIVDGGYSDIINAYFFLVDIEFNSSQFTYEVDLEDNNYGAFIRVGQKEEICVQATKTKNGETAVNNGTIDITIFTPSTGGNIGTDAKCYRVDHIMELIVSYLSDNKLSFIFDYDLPSVGLAITKHYFINSAIIALSRTPDNRISFAQLMDFFYKAYNLKFWIDTSYNPPALRIDHADNLMGDNGTVTFSQINELKLTFDQDKMISSVRLGSKDAIIDRTEATYQLRYAPLVNFSEEVINASSSATLDGQLDLLIDKFTIDTNKIEEMITVGVSGENWSENNVCIEYTLGGDASKGTYGTTGAHRLYNESLLNKEILSRHNVPTKLVSYLGTETATFLAYLSTDDAFPFSLTPIIFDTEDSDIGGNYNNATGVYTVPVTGVYRFHVQTHVEVTSLQTPYSGLLRNGIQVTLKFQRNGANVTSQSRNAYGLSDSVNKKFFIMDFYYEALLDAGDTIEADISPSFIYTTGTGTNSATLKGKYTYTDDLGRQAIGGTMFGLVFAWDSGGEVSVADTLDFPSVIYNFKNPISLNDWKALRLNPTQGIVVDTNGKNQSRAWIKRIQRNWITGESDITLFTTLNNNNI